MKFGEYFRMVRGDKSQERLANDLAGFDSVFSAVCSVTISRWENNLSFPPVKKIIRIIEYFGDNPSVILQRLDFPSKDEAGFDIPEMLSKKFGFSPKGEQIGEFPVLKKYQITDLNRSYDSRLVQLLLDFDHSIFDTEFPVTDEIVNFWSRNGENVNLVCSLHGHYLGHLISLRLKPESFISLINAEKEESEITLEDMAPTNEEHCLYIYSIYGANRTVASFFIVEMIKNILCSPGSCIAVGGLCATKDGINIAKRMGLELVSVGPINDQSDIRLQGKNVSWATYSGGISKVFTSLGERIISGIQSNISAPENLC